MIPLLLAACCVAANAFFVAAEFAFAKVRPTALEALARAGDTRASRALQMTRRLDAYLSCTQLGITLASLALGWLGEPALAALIGPPLLALGVSPVVMHGVALVLAFATISLLHIVIGELVPKSIAIRYPEHVSRWTAMTLRAFFVITWPAMWVLNGLSNGVLRLLRVPPAGHGQGQISSEEIRVIIRRSFAGEDENDRKRDLLERVLRGTDRPVRAVMVPRVDMVTASYENSVEELLTEVRKHGYSRYPICEDGDPDKVRGYVHIKDVLSAARERDASLRPMTRDVLFVPESTHVGELLSQFQRTHIPIAIVVDEYGGTDGLVTVEDVVEEMVGEIQDEHDAEQPKLIRREDGTLVVDGTLALGELEPEGFEVEDDLGAETIGGYVVHALDRLARPGDRVRAGLWDIVVEDVRRRRVFRAALHPRPPSEPPPGGRSSSRPPEA